MVCKVQRWNMASLAQLARAQVSYKERSWGRKFEPCREHYFLILVLMNSLRLILGKLFWQIEPSPPVICFVREWCVKSAWVQRLGVPRWRYRLWKPWGDEAISVGYRWKALNDSKCEYQKTAYKIPLNFIYRSQFYFLYLIWCRGFLQVMKFKMVYKNLKYMSSIQRSISQRYYYFYLKYLISCSPQQQRRLWHICRIVTPKALLSLTSTYKRSFLSRLRFT